ncbi:YhcH/YjgK/YiaL family protein [Youxingia wuxianensis]|uniref:YhcH/YjgK/YiaL family protein n=1 Tax=Youxingia wuxianensis TaxID=2763678 RepID=A0A926IH35_9FIRM|nr:YhcH/YjgK/YiaL family protein [Youxingia wuxianensis]MBC8584308.1 YhcH/YjgK/YiaL family protein [Youxingia wuxianensis]
MIYGNINAKEDLSIYPKAIQNAILFFKNSTDLLTRKPGYFDLDGNRLKLQVLDVKTLPRQQKRPEVHRQYVDVQLLVKGKEHMIYYPDLGNNQVEEDRLVEADTLFYKTNPLIQENFIEMQEGDYAILFPTDVHIPAVASENSMVIRKIVLKVHVDTL